MSHKEQRNYCKRMQMTFPAQFIGKSVLDVGSMDVNGSNRWLFRDAAYMGIDISPGRNVDRVCKVQDLAEVFDFVISTEVLEHDPEWWVTLDEMCKRVRPGGSLLVTCAGPGRAEHGTRRCPVGGMVCDSDYYLNLSVVHLLSVVSKHPWLHILTEQDGIRHDTRLFAVRAK